MIPVDTDVQSAVCFFCAAFLGENVEQYLVHVPSVLCIDRDGVKVNEMREHFPATCEFEVTDAYAALDRLMAEGARFDLVTVDPFTNQMDTCYARRADFHSIGKTLLLGIHPGTTAQALRDGASVYPRTDIAAWAVWT